MKISLFRRNLIFSILVTTLLLFVLEFAVRLKYYLNTKDETYLLWGRTDIEIIIGNFLKKTIISKQKDRPDEIKRETYSIAVFGGSTAYSYFVPRKYAWSQILERLLNGKFNKEIIVYNKGEGGSNCTKDVNRMRSFLAICSVDMIILYTGVNNMAKLLGGKINNKYYLKEKLESTFIQRLDAKLLKISLFYTTFKEKYNKMVKYDINKAYHRKKKDILVELIPLEWAGLKIYREKLTNAAKLCNKLDIMLVLATVPLRDGSDYYEKLKGEMRKVAKEFDLMFVDVANEFDAMDEEETKSLFLPDGVHLNKGGTAKVAEIIFRYFVNHRDGSELEVTI